MTKMLRQKSKYLENEKSFLVRCNKKIFFNIIKVLSVLKICPNAESAPLSFGRSLATKYVLLNNKPCMTRPAIIDLNPVEPTYYPFMITLDDACNESCNAVEADNADVTLYENMCSE